jgi:hypothetical protein
MGLRYYSGETEDEMSPELITAAALQGVTLRDWVLKAIAEKLKK